MTKILEAQRDGYRARAEALEHDLQVLRSSVESQRKGYKDQIEAAKTERDEAIKDSETAEAKLKLAETDRKTREKLLRTVRNERDRLQQDLDESDANKRAAIAQVEGNCTECHVRERWERAHDSVKAKLEEARKERDGARDRLDEAQTRIEELTEKADRAKEDYQMASEEANREEAEKKEAKRALAEHRQNAFDEIQGVKERLDASQQRVCDVNAKLDGANRIIALQDECMRLMRKLAAALLWKDEYDEAMANNKKLRERLEEDACQACVKKQDLVNRLLLEVTELRKQTRH